MTLADSGPILAAIDVGSNSIHMVVVRVLTAGPGFRVLAQEKEAVRLADRDKLTGDLTPQAMQRSLEVLGRFQILAQSLQAQTIIAVATSAVREAANGREFLAWVYAELGLNVDLISGPEEARRIYLGVLSGMDLHNQPHIVIDIGGGSTELILGDGHEPQCLSSTKVGAVRLTAGWITTDPPSPSEFQTLQAYVRGMLERPVEEIQSHIDPHNPPALIGTAGTIEALAILHAREKLGTVPDPLHGYTISLTDLRDLLQRLRRLNNAERLALPGMNERRADIIIAGALVLYEAMVLLNADRVTVCERALREGIIVDWMLTHGYIEPRLRYQSSVRQTSVLHTAQKYQVNLEHSRQVADLALSLFDQAQGPLHTWGEEERQLFWAAAMLHNCGHHVSHSSHHKHSYYLIRHSELLGYTETELETIANLARYHRKSPPRKKHENYRNLTSKTHRRVVDQLSALLRLAVALDRRQIGAVAQVRLEFQDPGVLLHLHPADPGDDCALELWSLNLKREAFETEFGRPLQVVLECPLPALATG